MAAPIVATKTPEDVQSAVKVLSTDIVKAEGKFFRRIRKKVPLEKDGKILLTPKGRVRYVRIETLEPVDVSVHANPIGLGVMGALGALGFGLMVGRIHLGVPGIGEIDLYKGPFFEEFEAWKNRRRCAEIKCPDGSKAEWDPLIGDCVCHAKKIGIGI